MEKQKELWLWPLVGFATVTLTGTLLHFLYEWTGDATWAAPFSAVNESTWEHMKLLFLPMFLFAIIQSFFFRDRPDYWCIQLWGILLGQVLIPVLFYTYNGAIGKSPDQINIAIFFVAAGAAYLYEARLLRRTKKTGTARVPAILVLCVLAFLFVLCTFVTPRIGLFEDPLTGTYGIPG